MASLSASAGDRTVRAIWKRPARFRRRAEIIGVYAKDWNLFAAPADHKGILDLDHATDADLLQLTTNGCSNKEPMWFVPAQRAKE